MVFEGAESGGDHRFLSRGGDSFGPSPLDPLCPGVMLKGRKFKVKKTKSSAAGGGDRLSPSSYTVRLRGGGDCF